MNSISVGYANRLFRSYAAQYVEEFFPSRQLFPPETNPFYLPTPWWENDNNKLVIDLLGIIRQIQTDYIQYRYGIQEEQSTDNDYNAYLQYPNKKIKELADSIVDAGDSNDEKAYKITQWVIDNIEYQSDMQTYGMDEYWAYPAMSLAQKAGDCEDGAFLIHSLMLHSGIPPEKIRTYGGIVAAGTGAETGGHGWTVYQRESDDQWVVLDWCYFPSQAAIDERIPMMDDTKYIDDYFFVTLKGTFETPYANKVRNPAVGNLVDTYA